MSSLKMQIVGKISNNKFLQPVGGIKTEKAIKEKPIYNNVSLFPIDYIKSNRKLKKKIEGKIRYTATPDQNYSLQMVAVDFISTFLPFKTLKKPEKIIEYINNLRSAVSTECLQVICRKMNNRYYRYTFQNLLPNIFQNYKILL